MSRVRLPSTVAAHPWRAALLTAVWVLVLASVVSWRRGAIYSGGLDATVVLKAVVALLAAAGALLLWSTATHRRRLSPYPTLLVFAIVGISLIGASTTHSIVPNVVLAARIGLLAGTVLVLLSSFPARTAVGSLLATMTGIGILAAASGLPFIPHAGEQAGRLGGGAPPLEPNELASLLLPPAIALICIVVRRGLASWPALGLVTLVGVIFLTGSRTALAMLVLAGLLAMLTAPRLSRGVVAATLAGVVGLFAMIAFTPLLAELALRGQGTGRLLTLNSRTISWTTVLALPKDQWSWWLGHGLSMKTIPVVGQYWSAQVFDSSWISSLAQDGVLGTALLALFAVGTLIAVTARPGIRNWALPLVGPILVRSFVENGLIESSVTFTLFFVIATAAWPGADPENLERPGVPVTVATRLPVAARTALRRLG